MRKIILFGIPAIILIALFCVFATDSNVRYQIISPENYSTSTSTSVNFNISLNWTGSTIQQNQINCSLFLKNTSAGAYVRNTSYLKVINATNTSVNGWGFINQTVVLSDKTRVWSFWRCINNYTTEILNSSISIIDIDMSYDTLSLGSGKTINFSMTTGNIYTKGVVTASGFTARGNTSFWGVINATNNLCQFNVTSGLITAVSGACLG